MRKKQKCLSCLLLSVLIVSLFTPVLSVQAAAKSIYVISSIKIKGTDREGKSANYTKKISYNKYGQITKITQPDSQDIVYRFSYDKKHRLTKFVEEIRKGSHKCTTTCSYTYKNGVVKKRVQSDTYGGKDIDTYTYKNGKIILKKTVSSWIDEETGQKETSTGTTKFEYKKDHVRKSITEPFTINYTLDKHGNYTKYVLKMKGGSVNKDAYLKATLTYSKNSLVKKRVVRYKNPMMNDEEKATCTISYKKIKVNSKYADMIAGQQWQLINSEGIPNGRNDACEAW